MNETLTTDGGRNVLRMERRFSHPVDKVWRALTEPAELGHWFPTKVEIDPVVGGKVRFVEHSDEYPSLDGEITDLDPPRLIAYTWDTDHLRWELRPDGDGDGCVLTLIHTFDDRYGAASFATGWTECIDALGLRLDGRPAQQEEGGLDRFADTHERFVEEFGLAEGTVRRTSEGWVVRFERQLVRPVDAVWSLLTGGNEVAVGSRPPEAFTTDRLPAGPVAAVDPPASLEYRSGSEGQGDPAGRVRWELSPGAGGARLVVEHTIPTSLGDYRPIALDAWRAHIADLARRVVASL